MYYRATADPTQSYCLLSTSCGRTLSISAGIYQFVHASFLSSPLDVVGYAQVRHSHIQTHVLFVGVIKAVEPSGKCKISESYCREIQKIVN